MEPLAPLVIVGAILAVLGLSGPRPASVECLFPPESRGFPGKR